MTNFGQTEATSGFQIHLSPKKMGIVITRRYSLYLQILSMIISAYELNNFEDETRSLK